MFISMFFVWAIVILLGVFIELNTQIQIGSGAVFGGLGGLITHGITKGAPLWLEFLVFFITWIVFWLIFFLIFLVFKKRSKEDGFSKYIGEEFEVYKTNKNSEFGEIKINATIFRFKNKDVVKKGEKVKILRIDGVTCKVERV